MELIVRELERRPEALDILRLGHPGRPPVSLRKQVEIFLYRLAMQGHLFKSYIRRPSLSRSL